MTEEIKQEEIKEQAVKISDEEITKQMDDLLNMNEISDLIKNNEKIFEFKGISYRIKKPTYKQRQEVYNKRVEKYIGLLKDTKFPLEKDLRKLYKERDIDIDKMDIELTNKVKSRNDLMIKLGEELKNKSPESTLKLLTQEIESKNDEINDLSMNKSSLLEFSLEQQISVFIFSYYTYVLTEKKEGENWVKVWNTFEEFENDDQDLINKSAYFITVMLGSELMK